MYIYSTAQPSRPAALPVAMRCRFFLGCSWTSSTS